MAEGKATDLQFTPDGVNVAVKQEGALGVQPTISVSTTRDASSWEPVEIAEITGQFENVQIGDDSSVLFRRVSDEDEARPPTSVTTKENLHLDSPQGVLRVNFSNSLVSRLLDEGDVSVKLQSSDTLVELHSSNWEEKKEGIRSKIKVEIGTSLEQSRDSFEHDVISQLLNSSDNYMQLRTTVNFLYDMFGAMLHRITVGTGGCIELWIKHATTEQYEEMKKNKYDIESMLTQFLSKKPNYYTLCIRFQDDASDSQRPTLGSTTKNAQGFLSSCDVPNDSEVPEGVNYTDNTSTTSKRNTNIPMEPLKSVVSVDAAPCSPTPSVTLGDTPVCYSSKVSVDTASCSPTPSVTLGDTVSVCYSSKVSVDAASCSPTPSVTLEDTLVCDSSKVSVDRALCSPTPSVTLGDTLVCNSSKVSVDTATGSPTPSVTLGATPICDGSTAGHNNTTKIGQSDTDTSVGVRQHSLTRSINPQLNQTSGTQNIIIANTVRDAKSCKNLPSQLNRYGEDDDLNVDYYDVMVLYAEADRSEATTFLQDLQNDIRLKNGESIKAELYDAPEVSRPTGLQFDILDEVSKRCVYIFVYLTKNIVDDNWFKIRQQSILMRNLDNQTWWVVPVYTKRRDENNFEIPMGLNALKGINYYANDDLYKKSVSSMVEEGRKRKQTELLAMRKKQIKQPKQGLETDRPITAGDLSLNLEASTSSTQTSRPGTDQDGPITEYHLNHLRLLNALATVSADGLRKILLSKIPPGYNDFYDLLRNEKHNLSLRPEQEATLFPDPSKPPASVDQYDITLLYKLIRHISSVVEPATGWGKEPKDAPNRDTTLGASTERIRILRNKLIGHHKDYQFDDTTFEGFWKEICQTMDDIEAVIGEKGYKEALRERRGQLFTKSEARRVQNKCKEQFLADLEELMGRVKRYPDL